MCSAIRPSAKARPSTFFCRAISRSKAKRTSRRRWRRKPATDLTGHGTILLVEDEEAVRAFGARALGARGYTVLEAAKGMEALEVAEQNSGAIDLIISDVVMPEMDGPTMFGELRKRGVTAKVIFVSGYAEEAFAKNLPGRRGLRLPAQALHLEAVD